MAIRWRLVLLVGGCVVALAVGVVIGINTGTGTDPTAVATGQGEASEVDSGDGVQPADGPVAT